ncbi:Krueppel-like factor 16 [Eriocheir sinensis]|uniref:Krueppel-like factor 16 n=1 Tax=Eriocheir sinensis TaxID=95602 RepID=UPI0021CA0D62|nr:Krueppel-like factor 16 [Eriocheir sinensis]
MTSQAHSPTPSPSPSPPSIFRPWQLCPATPVTSSGETSPATTADSATTAPRPQGGGKRFLQQVASSSYKRPHKMPRTEGHDVPPASAAAAGGSKVEAAASRFLGHNPRLPGNPMFQGLAGLGGPFCSFTGPGPLVPLLDVLVPASEVERVCARRPRPKRFGCSQCGSAFSNKGQLKGHLRIHTGERPFVCGHQGCHKRFTRNEELTRHRRIHSGARPFPCPLCDKRFGRKDHLKKHVRTHQRLPQGPAMHLPLPPPLPPCLTPPFMPPLAATLAASHPFLHRLQQLQQLHAFPQP